MKNWRTTLGGALGTLGTTLSGIGTVTAIMQFNAPGEVINKMVVWVIMAGFFISAIGKFFTALWTADAADVNRALADQNVKIQGNTDMITKPSSPPTP